MEILPFLSLLLFSAVSVIHTTQGRNISPQPFSQEVGGCILDTSTHRTLLAGPAPGPTNCTLSHLGNIGAMQMTSGC